MKIETQRIELEKLNVVGVCTYIEDELKIINIRHYLSDDIAISFILYDTNRTILFTEINGNICTPSKFYNVSSKYNGKYKTLSKYITSKEFKDIIKEFFGSKITITIKIPDALSITNYIE